MVTREGGEVQKSQFCGDVIFERPLTGVVTGVVRSKSSRGYVEVDLAGRDVAFYRTKFDTNWPRTGASNTTHK